MGRPDDEYEYDEYGYADEGAEEDYKEEPVRNTKKKEISAAETRS